MQRGGSLPIKPPSTTGRNLILVDDAFNCGDFLARHTPAVAIPKQLGYQAQLVDRNNLTFGQDDSRITLLQVFIRGNPFRGSASLTPATKNWLKQWLKNPCLQALLIYGSSYVLELLVDRINLPWVFSYGQMPAAQAIACEVLFGLSSLAHSKQESFL